jgi:hypothetical protein
VQKRILPIAITAISFISLIGLNCTKLDTTDIGSDQLPAVDNVLTFDTTLSVITTQGAFATDSTYILRTDDHAFGFNNDPVFGLTAASIYFQLKPDFYPYFIGSPGDTLNWPGGATGAGVDSVVLCLKYTGSYGDTMSGPLQVEVREVIDNTPLKLFRDSTNMYRNVNFQPGTGANVGSASIDIKKLKDTVKYVNKNGYSVNTIRIKLSSAYAAALYGRDTLVGSPNNNAFKTDSLFRRFYNGLAVLPVSGNHLIYTNLADVDTKLEIHYRRKNFGRIDTVISKLVLNSSFFGLPGYNRSSSTANYITRNRPALPSGDQVIYLQTSPGTYANISIPQLSTLSNRIVHRAELIVDEIPDATGTADKFKEPNYLYVELKDTGTVAKWKPVYYDLNPSIAYDPDYKNSFFVSYLPNPIDFAYYGGFIRNKNDVFGNATHYYNFNITRYIQNVITKRFPNYEMRLSAPFNVKYPQYSAFPNPYGNNIAYGRVKVGGGNNPNYRLRLRIVYSKL